MKHLFLLFLGISFGVIADNNSHHEVPDYFRGNFTVTVNGTTHNFTITDSLEFNGRLLDNTGTGWGGFDGPVSFTERPDYLAIFSTGKKLKATCTCLRFKETFEQTLYHSLRMTPRGESRDVFTATLVIADHSIDCKRIECVEGFRSNGIIGSPFNTKPKSVTSFVVKRR